MSKLQWAAVGTALVLGILSQIPRHDHEHMPGHQHDHLSDGEAATALERAESAADIDALPNGRRRVLLTVSGMT